MNKTKIISLISLIAVVFFLGCVEETSPLLPRTFVNVTISIDYAGVGNNFTLTKKIRVENRTLLFDAMENGFDITYTTHVTWGAFITSIEGIENTATSYWMYYVNGEHALVGVSAYQITEPVEIEWRYEESAY